MNYRTVLSGQITAFLNKISAECSINSNKIHPEEPDFPIFRPANASFFEYKYYEYTLERYIREYLVTPVFTQWLTIAGYHCKVLKRRINRKHPFQYTNEQYGDDYLFAFAVENKGRLIAYRYSSLDMDEHTLKSKLQKWNIDHFEILDWSDTISIVSKRENYSVPCECRKTVIYITLYKFLSVYFPDKLAEYYIEEVNSAVVQANTIIGFQAMPMLSLKHLSDFKGSVLHELAFFPLQNTRYKEFTKSGELSQNQQPLLSSLDIHLISERCFGNKLYHALVGKEQFAKCFMTSEYLYNIFKYGKQNFFDYSAIVSGYFKAVELLLEKLMLIRLNTLGNDELWIQSTKIKSSSVRSNPSKFRWNPQKERRGVQVRFLEENKSYFAGEMGALIWFVHDDCDHWYISASGKSVIHNCLLNYCKGCRNEHLHKDVIDDLDTMEAIRSNTILCLLFLLGGRIVFDSVSEDYTRLGASDDGYERLYRQLCTMPLSVKAFYIQFDNHPDQRAVRLFNQPNAEYDDFGNIKSVITFVKSDESSRDDVVAGQNANEFSEEDLIVLSPKNMPTRMWFYNRIKGKTEILW